MSSYQALGMQSLPRPASAPGQGCRGLALLVLFAAGGLGTIGLSSCWGTVCTAVGWFEGLTVELSSPDPLADGSYELAIEADGVDLVLAEEYRDGVAACRPMGEEGACTAVVPLPDDRHLYAEIAVGATSITVYLNYVDHDSLAGGPEVATIRVQRDNKTLFEGTFEPAYAREELNGDGCGVATTALVKVPLPPADAPAVAPR